MTTPPETDTNSTAGSLAREAAGGLLTVAGSGGLLWATFNLSLLVGAAVASTLALIAGVWLSTGEA